MLELAYEEKANEVRLSPFSPGSLLLCDLMCGLGLAPKHSGMLAQLYLLRGISVSALLALRRKGKAFTFCCEVLYDQSAKCLKCSFARALLSLHEEFRFYPLIIPFRKSQDPAQS